MRHPRISLFTCLFFSILRQPAFAASSTELYRFLYPSSINSSSIEITTSTASLYPGLVRNTSTNTNNDLSFTVAFLCFISQCFRSLIQSNCTTYHPVCILGGALKACAYGGDERPKTNNLDTAYLFCDPAAEEAAY